MTEPLPAAMLTLHAVRLLGFAGTEAVAARFGQGVEDVEAVLIDAGARGWLARSSFGGIRGWSLTEAGRRENERLLAAELAGTGARGAVAAAHEAFVPLNSDVVAACSGLQLRALGVADAAEDWPDGKAQRTFSQAVAFARGLDAGLAAMLPRFSGYAGRLEHALSNAGSDQAWYTGTDRDSFHHAWFELHEDFIATLGLSRA